MNVEFTSAQILEFLHHNADVLLTVYYWNKVQAQDDVSVIHERIHADHVGPWVLA